MTILHNNIIPTHNYDYMYAQAVQGKAGGTIVSAYMV